MTLGLMTLGLMAQQGDAQPRTPHPPVTEVELTVHGAHPRLVFRSAEDRGLGRTFEEVRKLYESNATFKAIFDKALAVDVKRQHPAMLAVCWIVTGEDRFAEAAVDRMVTEPLSISGEPYYSNIWSHALAYDWLYHHPALTKSKRQPILAKILERLETELTALDDSGMALWHGRNQAANNTMIAALAVADLPGQKKNLRRAAAHYIESLRALEFSEGWPEGASYWIYNRAGPYALAADCVMTALGSETIDGIPIRDVMRKIGLWSLYQFAPNEVFEPYGDSAGSLQLGQTGWWQLSTDYYARLSKAPEVMAGGDLFRNRSPALYGKWPYNWYIALAFDPSVRPAKAYDPKRPELWLRENLPQSMLFGRESIGIAFFRGDWGDPDELYATFKAGDLLAHHDHYDVGHFSIQRGGLLAPQTGIYPGSDGYFGAYRLGYTLQTVSSNSLLILAPGETSADLRRRSNASWTALSGGQRVIRPTGFDCLNLSDFKRRLNSGRHLERAHITAFESIPNQLDYLAADITAAYHSTRWAAEGNTAKVSQVTRQFVFLREEEAVVVYDRVETTNASYLPKFLLHSLSKPQTETESLLAGNSPEDGILATMDRRLVTKDHRGVLTQIVLLPAEARTLKIGGDHFYAYVESDGDQANGFDGVNLDGGDPDKPRKSTHLGRWRAEVEPTEPSRSTRFLNVLLPRLVDASGPLPDVKLLDSKGSGAHVVQIGKTVVVFAHDAGELKSLTTKVNGAASLVVLDTVPGGRYVIGSRAGIASGEGVLRFEGLSAGKWELVFRQPSKKEQR